MRLICFIARLALALAHLVPCQLHRCFQNDLGAPCPGAASTRALMPALFHDKPPAGGQGRGRTEAGLRVVRSRPVGLGGSGWSNSHASGTRGRSERAAKDPLTRRRARPNDAAGAKCTAMRVLIRLCPKSDAERTRRTARCSAGIAFLEHHRAWSSRQAAPRQPSAEVPRRRGQAPVRR